MSAGSGCSDPPEESCSDAGCPEHGEPDGRHYCEDYELCGTCQLCTGCCHCAEEDHADRREAS